MSLDELLQALFPESCQLEEKPARVVSGSAQTSSGRRVAIIATLANTRIGIDTCLELSRQFIRIMRQEPACPILMLVNNEGQQMSLREELLGLNQYIAHLLQLQHLARHRGHRVIALVYGNAIAGGFIAFGLGAGQTYALAGSNCSVMILPAIARITKLPLAYLEELSLTVPVFAPGIQNFQATGGLQEIWQGDLGASLERALACQTDTDIRAELGKQRGGRLQAHDIIQKVLDA